MKALCELSVLHPQDETGLILLLCGEVGRPVARIPHRSHDGRPDEHGQTGILTSGVKPRSCLPERPPWCGGPLSGTVGTRNPSQWRNRPRFARGSLSFGRDGGGRSVHRVQRTGGCLAQSAEAGKPKAGPLDSSEPRRRTESPGKGQRAKFKGRSTRTRSTRPPGVLDTTTQRRLGPGLRLPSESDLLPHRRC
jgi:hypothetical protein